MDVDILWPPAVGSILFSQEGDRVKVVGVMAELGYRAEMVDIYKAVGPMSVANEDKYHEDPPAA